MAGNASNADSEEPELLDELDEEEGAESTVAMASPSFDAAASGVPLPISNPPPAMPGVALPPLPTPQAPEITTGGGACPPSGASAPPAPRPAFPASPLGPVTPRGGIAAAKPATPQAPAPPQMPSRVPTFGRSTSRAPTVIGIAPPAPGAHRPPSAPSAPAAPAAAAPAAAAPAAPAPAAAAAPAAPRAPLPPVAKGTPPRPGTLIGVAGAPLASMPKSASVPLPSAAEAPAAPPNDGGDVPDSQKDDAPTIAGDSLLATLGAEAASAARAGAVGPVLGAPPVPRSGPSPLAKDVFGPERAKASPPIGARQAQGEEVATIAVPKGDFDRARNEAVGNAPAPIQGAAEEEDSTRAVPREELLRGQDAQLIVGDDAGGEDATLAVAPGNNEASSRHFAGLAPAMVADEAFPPPPQGIGAPAAPPPLPVGNPGPELGPLPQPPWGDPSQQLWGQAPMPHPGMHGPPISSPNMPASNPQMPISAPDPQRPPGSNPNLVAAPNPMLPQSGHMPISQPHLMQGPMSASGMYPQPISPRHAPTFVGPARKAKLQLSGQVILLIVVGVICLGIFVTGLVLFVKTRL
jgi:hypothetical protein